MESYLLGSKEKGYRKEFGNFGTFENLKEED